MRTETTDSNAKGRGARIAAENTTALTSPFVMHSTGKPDNELTSDDDAEDDSPPHRRRKRRRSNGKSGKGAAAKIKISAPVVVPSDYMTTHTSGGISELSVVNIWKPPATGAMAQVRLTSSWSARCVIAGRCSMHGCRHTTIRQTSRSILNNQRPPGGTERSRSGVKDRGASTPRPYHAQSLVLKPCSAVPNYGTVPMRTEISIDTFAEAWHEVKAEPIRGPCPCSLTSIGPCSNESFVHRPSHSRSHHFQTQPTCPRPVNNPGGSDGDGPAILVPHHHHRRFA